MNPPEHGQYNPDRPKSYDLNNIPMRTQTHYWKTIEALSEAGLSKKNKAAITRSTGISRLPLCAASVAFTHPTFFPLDPFHLFYENCMAFMWDIWTVHSKISDCVHFPEEKVKELGRLIPLAMTTLPPSFCGPIRDPYLKRQSQYKIYEWMALLHWFILPIATELSMNPLVIKNFSRFVEAIEFAMTIKSRNEDEIQYLHQLIVRFLEDYESIYIGQDPEKINRARLCIFQLIHVPLHIQWNGSIRLGSQATVERSIGEMGHKIRSKKAPFANLANLIYQRELVKILKLYYPAELSHSDASTLESDNVQAISINGPKLVQQHNIAWTKLAENSNFSVDLKAIAQYLGVQSELLKDNIIGKWGKVKLKNGDMLCSQLSRKKTPSTRRSEWFQAPMTQTNPSTPNGFNLIFGEARAFYKVSEKFGNHILAVYTPLQEIKKIFHIPRGKWNPDTPMVLEVSSIQSLVGIWVGILSKEVYILRKHPGLQLLTQEEHGLESEELDTVNNTLLE
ncbi:hypothetical protein HYPSUDRAFT_132751 [Hypholoma sublateritium FD-334 SS-4]|uniref:Uncharacterized protein n=1 Tax=Hypholoma sublateritium (strain FD-334 SS-4) TaxID=945553 RepID=A0A0D2MR42_HYPSF|nr:hypothetical protein HYPSUDRAFT_132751 [Hypholoma sublateritium FD-334 SS-4]